MLYDSVDSANASSFHKLVIPEIFLTSILLTRFFENIVLNVINLTSSIRDSEQQLGAIATESSLVFSCTGPRGKHIFCQIYCTRSSSSFNSSLHLYRISFLYRYYLHFYYSDDYPTGVIFTAASSIGN